MFIKRRQRQTQSQKRQRIEKQLQKKEEKKERKKSIYIYIPSFSNLLSRICYNTVHYCQVTTGGTQFSHIFVNKTMLCVRSWANLTTTQPLNLHPNINTKAEQFWEFQTPSKGLWCPGRIKGDSKQRNITSKIQTRDHTHCRFYVDLWSGNSI